MACNPSVPFYFPWSQNGIKVINAVGDGYTISMVWHQAYAEPASMSMAYNIYYSSTQGNAIAEGPKFISTNNDTLLANVIDFIPGDTYYFVIRATQYDPSWYNIELLPTDPAQTDGYLHVYPETLLASDITDEDTTIPITDADIFPAMGVIKVGYELIRYISKDIPNNLLFTGERGFLNTEAREHTTDGYDGYEYLSPVVRFWYGLEEQNLNIIQEQNTFNYDHNIYTVSDGYRIANKEGVLTTDLGNQDEDNIDFPPYDFSGWHRTDPKLFFNGMCQDTYIGGEHFCADGYLGVNRQIRNISISDQAKRRQEFLLEQMGTGDEVMLMRRLWKGITCSCYEPNQEYPDHRCHQCFTGDTLVRTSSGYRPIREIKVGDYVLADDGSFQRVLTTFENDFDGELVGITPSVSTDTIWSTPEHPHLVMRGDHDVEIGCGPKCDNFIKRGDGFAHNIDVRQLPSGRWHARVSLNKVRKAIGTFDTQEKATKAVNNFRLENVGHVLKWDAADTITDKDWLVAKWPEQIRDVSEIVIPSFVEHSSNRNGKDKFVVDEEFLWMVGLYLAEGSTGRRCINFALHKKEQDFANRVTSLFAKYGYNSKVRQCSDNGNGININVNGTTLCKWFSQWLGRGCENKHIPEELMYLPSKKMQALLRGIYDGDGDKSCNEIGQTSEILSLQISEILHRLGELPLIRQFINTIPTPAGNERKKVYFTNWAETDFVRSNRKNRWKFNDQKLSKIRKVERKKFVGKVYNLEVEERNTYVVQGVVTHNCYGTGFITGYEQYFWPRRSDGRIMVRFTPAAEDLKMEEAGLENHAVFQCWTLPIPTIRDRDVLIRFNPDGTEEYRYEVLDVTRNKLLFNQIGNQHFSVQRVRKTSPIYQWRAIRNTALLPQTVTTTVGLLRGPNNVPIPHTHDIVVNENILVLSQINQTTSVSENHNHAIINGVVQDSGLGHTHEIVL